MANKRKSPPTIAVTAERAARLHRLVALLAAGPQTRAALRKQMRMDVRSFYRDLWLLRKSGIKVVLRQRHYVLTTAPKTASARLPFPDPHLNLGEAAQLAKGNSAAHRKLRGMLARIVGPSSKSKK